MSSESQAGSSDAQDSPAESPDGRVEKALASIEQSVTSLRMGFGRHGMRGPFRGGMPTAGGPFGGGRLPGAPFGMGDVSGDFPHGMPDGARGGFGRGGHRGHTRADHHHPDHADVPEGTAERDGRQQGDELGQDDRRGGSRGGGRGHDRALGRTALFRMLDVLAAASSRDEPLGVSALAEAIGVDQPRASRLVQHALAHGLIMRGSDPRDARRSVIDLTEAGRSRIEMVRTTRRTAVQQAVAGFTPDELETFAALLARFVRSTEQ